MKKKHFVALLAGGALLIWYLHQQRSSNVLSQWLARL